MYLPKCKIGYLLLAVLCCLLLSSAAYAVDQEDKNAPTDENLWKAQQAGDLETAARIKAILDERSSKVWGRRVEEDMEPWPPPVVPPIKDDAFLRPAIWGNDVTIATGTVSGGISTDYDNSGNIYAVRCTTYAGNTNGKVDIYKSTNGGTSWSRINGWQSSTSKYTYPVVLTGTDGTPDKLYVFYLRSSNNGDVRVGRYTLDGTHEGWWDVKADSDTITYFTVCANYGVANRLMLAYQREKSGDTTPDIYTIRSTDRGATWGSQVWITLDGSHPDIAYGYGGYTYMVYTKTGGTDDEITACRSTDYAVSWGNFEALTADSWDDDYAKVAATHTIPYGDQYVWVGYTHDYAGLGNWDMRFAYSSNAGVNWSKGHILAEESDYDEMACDLWVGRKTNYVYVNICYLRTRYISPKLRYHDIYYAYVNKYNPTTWTSHGDISNYWGAFDYDGRKVCQGTYGGITLGWRGVVYAGRSTLTNYYGLYFDNQQWTDVEDETGEGVFPTEFALSDNYPNPFNPETRIGYFVPRTCQVRLEVFNLLGQKIKTLVDEHQTVGNREVSWDGRNQAGDQVASGVYFYKLNAEDFTQTKKMVLIR